MFGSRKDVVYKILATKKRAVALQTLSAELETPMPAVLKTVKQLESDGLVEVFYGQKKASIMVRAKTMEDYI
ncbi:helix-turn-helix transcriptional regulator [Thermococcus sp. 21S7]|uniref:helix-turn-helix transcriptional regulator n=1 Tax=Thermococcus sp. 21S7 TaxID=1638221 RepID=UPI00143A34C2|nr:helix-turn-helix transcriptional regulator [Thermococcus sp. 21S7]NJE60741.1 ArsR family transcriptional regulator [Thermococcus sp. 21S7]